MSRNITKIHIFLSKHLNRKFLFSRFSYSSLGSSHHSDIDCVLNSDQPHQSPNFTEQIILQNEQIDSLAKENDELKTDMTKLKVSKRPGL